MTLPCGWPPRDVSAGQAAVLAFTQACREEGIPPHPGGACPSLPCPCQDEAVAGRVEARALALAAAALGIGPATLDPG